MAIQVYLDGHWNDRGSYGITENRLILQPDVGKVGIGTTNPSEILDVAGNIKASGDICTSIKCLNSIGSYWTQEGSNVYGSNIAGSVIINQAVGGLRVTSGKVGIMTDTPNYPLSLGGGLGDKLAVYDSGPNTIYGFGVQSGRMYIKAGNTEAMNILSNGNVGIGTSNPAIKLAIVDSDTGFGGPSDGNLAILTNGAERIRIDASGNVGIGTNNPKGKFAVSGSNDDEIVMYSLADNQLAIQTTLDNNPLGTYGGEQNQLILQPLVGNVKIGGKLLVQNMPANQLTSVCVSNGPPYTFGSCSSSVRYKENVRDLNIGLETVEKLRPVSFNWKASGDADVGLIAEEVYKVNPNLVTYDGDGKIIGVKYDQLSAVLIKGMQEQQKRIETLEKKCK